MMDWFPDKLHLSRKALHGHVLPNALLSWSAYRLSLLMRRPVVWGMPPIVMIEPTDACNLRCPLCPSGAGELTRPKGFIDFDLYCRVVDQIASTTLSLILWNQGEPFLHPRFYDMVAYASRKGLYTMTSTNANVPFDVERLVGCGLGGLIVSMDGTTQQTYEKYRVGGNLEVVLDNLRRLRDAKAHRKASRPFVRLQLIVMRHNEHEIPEIRRVAREMNVNMLELKTAQIYRKEDIEEFLPQDPAYRRYRIVNGDFELKGGVLNRCRRIWTQPVVNWNGEMAMCCYDKDIQYKIGNLNESSFRELWHGEKLQKLRMQILRNRAAMPVCKNCGEGVVLPARTESVR